MKRECDELERKLREEWVAKEGVMENVMEAELAVGERKGLGLGEEEVKEMKSDMRSLDLRNGAGKLTEEPWWRKEAGLNGDVALTADQSRQFQVGGNTGADSSTADPTLMAAQELLEMSAGKGHEEKVGAVGMAA